MIRLLRRSGLARDERGSVMVEFALLAPIVVLLLFAAAEGANLLLAYNKTQSAAESVADLVAQEISVSDSSLGDLFHAGELVMAPFPTAAFGVAAASVRYDLSTGAPAVDWQASLRAPFVGNAAALAAGLGGKGESAIVVRAQFDYAPLFASLFGAAVPLSKTAIARPRRRSFVPHT